MEHPLNVKLGVHTENWKWLCTHYYSARVQQLLVVFCVWRGCCTKSDDNDALLRLFMVPLMIWPDWRNFRKITRSLGVAQPNLLIYFVTRWPISINDGNGRGAPGRNLRRQPTCCVRLFCWICVCVFGTAFLLRTFLINSINSSNPVSRTFFLRYT